MSINSTGVDQADIMPMDAAEEASFSESTHASVPPGVLWYNTWKQAASYRKPAVGARPLGILKAGHNYFYGQKDWGVRAIDSDSTGRKYTSTWWALTDDDRGNTKVWVSCIYFTGGANDQPVKGLPVLP
jgi:hypothetical protein